MKYRTNSVFFIITATFIFILYLLLQPKILPKVFNICNDALLNDFIAKTEKTKKVDVQDFWKMREYYCPGSLTFDKTKNPFLVYTCKWLKSEEYLISEEQKNAFSPKEQVRISKDSKIIHIVFAVPASEMKKAIGYFDYNEKDKDLVKDRRWLDITFISRK